MGTPVRSESGRLPRLSGVERRLRAMGADGEAVRDRRSTVLEVAQRGEETSLPGIPGYQLRRRLGSGLAGSVYEAVQVGSGRVVALKVLAGADQEPWRRERFRREAEVLASSPHPCLVPLLDVGLDASPPYLAMELMRGGDLRNRISSRGPAPLAEVCRLGARLADGLAHLHSRGIVHRDLKPENVLLDAAGIPYLADLGLGMVEAAPQLTATGLVMGTLQYMAPEVIAGSSASPASDLFTLGLVLLELATGRRPPVTLEGAELSADLVALVPSPGLLSLSRNLLRTAPDDRPSSAKEVRLRLERMLDQGAEVPSPRPAVRPAPVASVSPSRSEPAGRAGPGFLAVAALVGALAGGGSVRLAAPTPRATTAGLPVQPLLLGGADPVVSVHAWTDGLVVVRRSGELLPLTGRDLAPGPPVGRVPLPASGVSAVLPVADRVVLLKDGRLEVASGEPLDGLPSSEVVGATVWQGELRVILADGRHLAETSGGWEARGRLPEGTRPRTLVGSGGRRYLLVEREVGGGQAEVVLLRLDGASPQSWRPLWSARSPGRAPAVAGVSADDGGAALRLEGREASEQDQVVVLDASGGLAVLASIAGVEGSSVGLPAPGLPIAFLAAWLAVEVEGGVAFLDRRSGAGAGTASVRAIPGGVVTGGRLVLVTPGGDLVAVSPPSWSPP